MDKQVSRQRGNSSEMSQVTPALYVCLVSSLFTGCGIRAEGFSGSVIVTPSYLCYSTPRSLPPRTLHLDLFHHVDGLGNPVQHNLKYPSGILLQSASVSSQRSIDDVQEDLAETEISFSNSRVSKIGRHHPCDLSAWLVAGL